MYELMGVVQVHTKILNNFDNEVTIKYTIKCMI